MWKLHQAIGALLCSFLFSYLLQLLSTGIVHNDIVPILHKHLGTYASYDKLLFSADQAF
jgi:hypothetical protein